MARLVLLLICTTLATFSTALYTPVQHHSCPSTDLADHPLSSVPHKRVTSANFTCQYSAFAKDDHPATPETYTCTYDKYTGLRDSNSSSEDCLSRAIPSSTRGGAVPDAHEISRRHVPDAPPYKHDQTISKLMAMHELEEKRKLKVHHRDQGNVSDSGVFKNTDY